MPDRKISEKRAKHSKMQDKQAINQQLIKEVNKELVFSHINCCGQISRAEIAKRTGLSPTTVSSLVDELIRSGFVIETGTKSNSSGGSGRKPIMLEIDPKGGYVLSVEITENGFKCCLYDLTCREVMSGRSVLGDFTLLGRELADAMESICGKVPGSRDKLIGIIAGVPALIDTDSGRIISSTVIPVNPDSDFADNIREIYPDIPVIVENESFLCAYAEKEYGSGKLAKDLVFIDIGTGIGAGIIIDGRIYTGAYGLAGEIGHMTVDVNGVKCKCGSRGCFEVTASVNAMIQKVIYGLMSGRETLVRNYIKNDINKLDIDAISHAAARNDRFILEIADEMARLVAYGINNIINIFNPQVVVIGGEMTKLGDVMLDRIREEAGKIGIAPNRNRTEIVFSVLSDKAATLGGARYILDRTFKQKNMWSGAETGREM